MLALTGAQKYYFVEGVTDMRLGQYRLCKVVERLLHRNPYNGDTFIFMSKDRRVSKIVRYEYGKYLLYVIALERDLKFMKVVHRNPIVNEDGTGAHYEIKWKQLVALFSCPVRSVIRI
ncbi:MAG: IS66 family insertion sequence element accessory protein TnpB [Prevotella sp.]|jgi:hypothetical protein|nr:IS66 family insertion sequence element accessory protein TnpB [Prevotella sp.]